MKIMRAFFALISWAVSPFKRCRNSSEVLQYNKYFCLQTELKTLEVAAENSDGDPEKIRQRIAELNSNLEKMPRGHMPLFIIYLIWLILCLVITTSLYEQILPFIETNWEHSHEYLLRFRGNSVWFWTLWKAISAGNWGYAFSGIWLAGVFMIQSRMLWFRSYVFIWLAGAFSTLSLAWFVFCFFHLNFRPLL